MSLVGDGSVGRGFVSTQQYRAPPAETILTDAMLTETILCCPGQIEGNSDGGKPKAEAAARKAKASVPRWQLRPPAGGSKVKVERGDCQNLSIWVSESVILGELRVSEEMTIPENAVEKAEFASKGTSDFRHLGLWPSECDSTSELVIQPKR